jgi:hypothetical protein
MENESDCQCIQNLGRFLFRPNKELVHVIKKKRSSLPSSYTAMHIRVGGGNANTAEKFVFMDQETLQGKIKAMLQGISTPIYLSSDSDSVMNSVINTTKQQCYYMTEYPRGHTAKYLMKSDLAMLKGAMVDLALLSMTTNRIVRNTYQSSYGYLALMLSQHTCSLFMKI